MMARSSSPSLFTGVTLSSGRTPENAGLPGQAGRRMPGPGRGRRLLLSIPAKATFPAVDGLRARGAVSREMRAPHTYLGQMRLHRAFSEPPRVGLMRQPAPGGEDGRHGGCWRGWLAADLRSGACQGLPMNDGPVIRTPDRRLRVFVSSTMSELTVERQAVSRAISALRLTPVMFEAGARPHPPRDVYRAYLAQSDVFIGLYWQQYGKAAPGMAVSGLEEEFQLSSGLPRLLYVKGPAPDREPRLAGLLARIREDASVSYRHFQTPAELGRLVRDDLAALLSERFAAAGRPAAAPAPPSRATARGLRPLPVSMTSLVGREREIDEVAGLIGEPRVRLVTLTGPGGVGKTRLAVAVGERLRDRYAAGTVFVSLAAVTDPGLVLPGIGRVVGADLAGTGPPLQALGERLGDGAWLLILDNLEQVVEVAADLSELMASCPGVVMLATSRTTLGLAAEREYPVPPLSLPGGAAVRRPGPRRPPGLRPDRGQRRRGRGDLPAAGRPAAGDRAGRRPHPAAGPKRAASPADELPRRARNRRGGPARAPAHPAGHRRVERGPAGARRTVAAGDDGGVRRRLDRRGRGAGGRPG